MAYYVITEVGVYRASTIKGLNKKLKAKFDRKEFVYIGKDAITRMDDKDIDFVQDKKRLSQIPIETLYKKDYSKYVLYFILFIQLIILIKR